MRNQPEYSKVEIQKLFEEAINKTQFIQRSWCSKTSIEIKQEPFFDTGIPLIKGNGLIRKEKTSSIQY